MNNKLEIVLPWDKVKLKNDSRLRWSISFLRDRNVPSFVYDKPPAKTAERVSFLTKQLCTKKRRWIVCFGDDTAYTNKLFYYVTASFVLTSGLSAEITTPKKLVEFAFNFGDEVQIGYDSHSLQVCELLSIPYFDPMYPGYQKARPKIAALLSERKLQKKSCMIEVYVPRNLPLTFDDLSGYAKALNDVLGKQAGDLFGGNEAKFITIKREIL